MLVVVRFRIAGGLKFLSHAETVRLFQRACVRAGINLHYSQGFNPRPKLSLPLPRSVGVETDDDLLCLRLRDSVSSFSTGRFKNTLSAQLPDGCRLLTVRAAPTKASFQPCLTTYVLTVRPEYPDRKLKDATNRLLTSKTLNLRRRIDAKGNIRNVDVRPFLKSIEFDDSGVGGVSRKDCKAPIHITVECIITSGGTIRVEEILKLLQLDARRPPVQIRRTSIQWQGKTAD